LIDAPAGASLWGQGALFVVDEPNASDPPSVTAAQYLDHVLGWFLQQDRAILGPLLGQGTYLSPDDLAGVRAALAREAPLTADQFDALVRFANIMPGIASAHPGAPACNLGDVLTAVRTTPSVDERWTWTFQPKPDADVLAKLEVRETSLGLAKNQRANRESWWAHGERNRTFVEDAIEQMENREVVVLLGVGPGTDLPLATLARKFDRLLLIDIDGAQLEETAARVFPAPDTRDRVALLPMDLTGVNQSLVNRVDELLADARDAADAVEVIGRLARSYRLPEGPQILPPLLRADLMVSSCVLSQISWPQRRYASARLAERFGALPAVLARPWNLAWTEFELRVQQDHINGLCGQSDVVALTCDTVNHKTALDHAGTERVLGTDMFFLHARSLRDRLPQFLSVDRAAAWPWSLLAATRKNPEGVRVDVEAYVLHDPQTPPPEA
jgi:hypothetical protein